MTTLSLKDSELFRQQAFIAGRWCEADNGKSFPVTNPATGAVLAQVPDMEATETRRAIEAAKAAWPEWRRKTAKERATLLRKWYDQMMANVDDLAWIMNGKAYYEAEVQKSGDRPHLPNAFFCINRSVRNDRDISS